MSRQCSCATPALARPQQGRAFACANRAGRLRTIHGPHFSPHPGSRRDGSPLETPALARRDLGGRGHRSGDSFGGKRVTHRRFRNRAARRGAVSHGWKKGGQAVVFCCVRKEKHPSRRFQSRKSPSKGRPLPFALYFTTSGRLKKEG